MKRFRIAPWLAVVVLAFLIFLAIGCTRQKDKLDVGPMPPRSIMPDASARQFAADMRAWLNAMDQTDLKTLRDTGHLTFSWKQLETSDPEHAAIIDEYVEQKRVDFAKVIKRRPLPDRLAVHHYPDTIEFERVGDNLRVVIASKKGLAHTYVQIEGDTL